ncbi:MAG: helix-turn-helix domain-containing protein [Paludibacteraceae bacterium]
MIYTIFSIMPMFVALFWVILLLIDRWYSNLSKRFLAFFLSLSFVNYFTHALFFNNQYGLYAIFDSIWCFTSLAGYPLYYYYIRLLTKDVKIDLKLLWLIIPSLLVATFSAVLYIRMSPDEVNTFIHGVMYHESDLPTGYSNLVKLQILRLSLFKIVFAIQVILTIFFGIRLILDYNTEIKNFYSNTGGKDLTPIRRLLFFFVIASFVSFFSNAIGKDFFVTHPFLLAIPSVTHSLYLFGIGYVGYKQDFAIQDFQNDLLKYEEINAAAYSQKQMQKNVESLRPRLMELLEKDEIYMNPDLRISDLSYLLSTNRSYASMLIHKTFHASFADVINTYRVQKAKELMHSNTAPELSQKDILIASGFASESSFYRAFKKDTGLSPSNYMKSLENQH